MKFRTTQKAVNAGYNKRISIGYCNIQTLLAGIDPVAYTARREGWAADIYDMGGGVAIVTGYAPFGNVRVPYDTQRRYEEEARKIRYDYSRTWEDIQAALQELLRRFVEEVTQK